MSDSFSTLTTGLDFLENESCYNTAIGKVEKGMSVLVEMKRGLNGPRTDHRIELLEEALRDCIFDVLIRRVGAWPVIQAGDKAVDTFVKTVYREGLSIANAKYHQENSL